MYLGIEIGGTKLQLAVGPGDGSPLIEFQRAEIRVEDGAGGILRQIEIIGRELIDRHQPRAIGIGFGGPVDAEAGRTITSHQVEGWTDFALVDWCRETFGLPAALSNDADAAGLAEALFGAGRGHRVVFYITVGSGIGGALVVDGRVYSGGHGIASEIGHLRPGLDAGDPHATVESFASGFGIAAAGRAWLGRREQSATIPSAADLLARCGGRIEQLSGRMVIEAAAAGNVAAQQIFARALQTLGWADCPDDHARGPAGRGDWRRRAAGGRGDVLRAAAAASGPLRLPAAGPFLFDRPRRVGRGSGRPRGLAVAKGL